MLKEFRDFAMKGNVVDMAVGIIIGAAFGTIVASLVADIIMPPIGMLLGGVDFTNIFVALKEGSTAGPYPTLAAAQAAGAVTMNVGMFLNKVFSFMIVAFSVFMLVKAMNKAKSLAERKAAAVPAAAAPPSDEVLLLREIRDALKQRA